MYTARNENQKLRVRKFVFGMERIEDMLCMLITAVKLGVAKIAHSS
jgi:hypothetical protein